MFEHSHIGSCEMQVLRLLYFLGYALSKILMIPVFITATTDKDGLAMAHLAIMCKGTETDFKDTIKTLNEIW